MDIKEFLEARISEDERHARKLAETDRRPVLSLATTINHPQRLLAECAAKRRILFDLEPHRDLCGIGPTGDAVFAVASRMYAQTLGLLAAVYADHPDYRQEWVL